MKSGEEYERLSTDVVRDLYRSMTVTHNVKIMGRLTEINRQIDVKLDESEYDFVMYECKDWKKSIGVGVVGQLLTDLEDVGARKGAIISNSRFTKGAINLATKKGVDLLHLVKTSNPKARGGIAAQAIARVKIVDKFSFSVSDTSFNAPRLTMDPDEFIIVDRGNALTMRDYLGRVWNAGLNATAQIGANLIEVPNAEIIDTRGDHYIVTLIEITAYVEERLSEGIWPVEEAQGLYNVIDKSFQSAGNIRSTVLSIDEMDKAFKPISAEEAAGKHYLIELGIVSGYEFD